MTQQTAAIPLETLAGLLTAPVELGQALMLKDCYDRLPAAAAPPASESPGSATPSAAPWSTSARPNSPR